MVEIWLYVAYVPVMLVLARWHRSEPLVWLGLSVVWLAGLSWVRSNPDATAWWWNSSFVCFLPYWWIGAAFAAQPSLARNRRWVLLLGGTWVGLTVWFVSTDGPPDLYVQAARQLLLATLAGVAIAVADDVRRRRAPTSLTTIGVAGYSVYAFHAPVLVVLLLAGVPWFITGLLAVAVGLLSHRWIEVPSQRRARAASQRLKPAVDERSAR